MLHHAFLSFEHVDDPSRLRTHDAARCSIELCHHRPFPGATDAAHQAPCTSTSPFTELSLILVGVLL